MRNVGFCMKCGKRIGEGNKFCPSCGAAVGTASGERKAEAAERVQPGSVPISAMQVQQEGPPTKPPTGTPPPGLPPRRPTGGKKKTIFIVVGTIVGLLTACGVVGVITQKDKQTKKDGHATSSPKTDVGKVEKSLKDFTEDERKQIYWDIVTEQDKASPSDPEYNKKMEQATGTVASKWETSAEVCSAIAIEATEKRWPLPEPELRPPPAELPSTKVIDPNQYPAGSADRAFAEYLEAWGMQDWNRMYDLTQLTWRSEKDPMELQNNYDFKGLKTAEIASRSVVSETCVDFTANISYKFGSEVRTEVIKARVIRESAPYQPDPNGTWGVNPISTL